VAARKTIKEEESSIPRMSSGKKIFIIFIVLAVMFGLWIVLEGLTPNADIVSITNVFVDINGDGLVDLIRSADVILNTGSNITFP
jgi:hypothetical protein